MTIMTPSFLQLDDAEDDEFDGGVKVYRPYPEAIKAARFAGWVLLAAGAAEVVIGALLFEG